MKLSNYFLPILKETPSEAKIKSHQLMLRSGMIRQSASGIYSWLPLGFKVLKNIENALEKSNLKAKDVELLCTGTTQGDLPIPGFASMVHAGLDFNRCEIASFQSVCASGVMALKNAFVQIKCNEIENAVCVGSEFASRLFKASRFEAQQVKSLPFDAEFLRWMLSDGAGAFVLQNKKYYAPRPHFHGLLYLNPSLSSPDWTSVFFINKSHSISER